MDELLARIVANTGLSAESASTAVGIILKFLHESVPAELSEKIMTALPGAEALIAAEAQPAASGLGSLLAGIGSMMGGGGLMGAFTSLTSAGLDMSQIQSVTGEVVGYAREKAGHDTVNEILHHIPGLGSIIG